MQQKKQSGKKKNVQYAFTQGQKLRKNKNTKLVYGCSST